MQFSDTSNRDGLIQDCEFWVGLGDAGISGDTNRLKHFTRLLNQSYHKAVTAILESQDEWQFDDTGNLSNYPECTRPLVAGQRDYLFATALWSLIGREGASAASDAAIIPSKILRVDISYDGTNWVKAVPIDDREMIDGLGNTSLVDGRFSKDAPRYDVKYNSLWVYPTATAAEVTSGAKIRLIFSRLIDDFVSGDTTQQPAIEKQFHRFISLGASLDWAVAKGLSNKNDIAQLLADIESRMRTFYGKKNEDRDIVLKPYYDSYA